jgi:hypothetical protein
MDFESIMTANSITPAFCLESLSNQLDWLADAQA